MNFIVKSIPNTLTSLSLVCGCMSVVASVGGDYFMAMCLIFAGAVFDFSDGFAARLLKAQSAIGKELDSLADEVSFGVAPGFMLYFWIMGSGAETESGANALIAMGAFVIPVFSALRLAKFNIDERQTSSFIGLPTPANAIFFSSLVATADTVAKRAVESGDESENWFLGIMGCPFALVGLAVAFSLLLVSELPMFSLKFKHYGIEGNKDKYALIGIAVVGIALAGILEGMPYGAIPAVIGVYIAICVIEWAKGREKEEREAEKV